MLTEAERGLLADLVAVVAEAVQEGDLLGHVRAWGRVAGGRANGADRWGLAAKGKLALEDCAAGRCADCRHYVPDAVRPESGRCAAQAGGWYAAWLGWGCVAHYAPREGAGTVAESVPAALQEAVRA